MYYNPLYLFGKLWPIATVVILCITFPTFVQRMLVMTIITLVISAVVSLIAEAVEDAKKKKRGQSAQP